MMKYIMGLPYGFRIDVFKNSNIIERHLLYSFLHKEIFQFSKRELFEGEIRL